MSKNLTRKGLALGAIVALGTTLFAGAPAQAAGETISLGSAYGTSTKTIIGSTFDLSSTLTGWASAPAHLSYWVTGVSAADLAQAKFYASTDHNNTSGNMTTASVSAPADKTTPAGVVFNVGNRAALGSYNDVRVGLASGVTATTSITVTAFDDSIVNDGKITAGEVASSPVTITFVKASEVTATTTLDAPVVGATSLKAYVSLGDINLEQVTGDVVRLQLNKNGTASPAHSSSTTAVWSKDDAKLAYTFSPSAIAAADVFAAQAYVYTVSTTSWAKSGVASGLVNAATPTSEVVFGADQVQGASSVDVIDSSTTVGKLRAKKLSIAFKTLVKVQTDEAADAAAPAGIPAKVTISDSNLLTDTLTVGGKTLKAAGDAITIATTTDANGYVNFTVDAAKALATEAFTVKVEALDKTSGYIATSVKTYTYESAIETKFASDIAGASAELSVVKGGSISFGLGVYDQFGQPFSSTDGFKAFVTSTGASSTGTSISSEIAITNGLGAVSITDNSTATGTYSLHVVLKEWDATNSVWVTTTVRTAANADISADVADIVVNVVSDNAVKSLTATNNSATPTVETVDFKNVDTRTGATAPALVSTLQGLTGKAFAADGSALAGVAVTVTGNANILFKASGTVYRAGSITVRTNSSGTYNVEYVSHIAGKAALVVSAGSATKSVTGSTFAAPTAITAVSTIAVTGDAKILPGRTATYTFTLKDKFGNTVEASANNTAKVTYTGPGYFTAALPTAFGADGTITLTLVAGSSDLGAGTLTVIAKGTDGATGVTTGDQKDDVKVAYAITIGATPVVVAPVKSNVVGKTKSFTVSVSGNASAKNVVVKVAGKTVATLKGSKSAKTYIVKATKGSKKVTVYVGGKLIATKTVSVK